MSFPPYKRLKAALRRRHAITNSLDLTRSLTIQLSTWLTVRMAFSFSSSRYFAELREDVLLLYPVAQLVHYASAINMHSVQTQSHTTLSSIAQKIPAKHVISFAIEATRFVERAQHAVLVKTRGKPTTRIVFESHQQRTTWMQAISDTLNREKKQLSDFKLIKHVGKGASGRVYKVLDTTNNQTLALKVIDKAYVFETESSYRHAMDERIVLQTVRDHPFVLDMRYAFQNAKRLFLVTEFCGGGDMFEFLNQRPTPLGEEAARFVACEIILAIEHIHNLGIVYRDLKLENILIDAHGHIRLADFGLTKVLRQDNGKLRRTNTFCGTKEYVAPEMIRGDSYDMSLDFWALGILLYEMMSGKTPFYHDDHDQIYDRIEKAPIFFPTDLSPEVRSLITSLLKRRPLERLGTGSMGIEEIKLHDWFKNVNWNAVRAKAVDSPLRKGLRFRRESLDDSQLSPRAKKRRQEQREAMAAVEEDLKADERYVSSLGSSVSIASRPKAPMEKWRGGILAGYCFRSLKPCEKLVPEAPTPPSPPVMKEVSEESVSEAKVEATGSGFMSDSTSAVALMTTTSNAGSEKDVTDTDPSSEGSEACSLPSKLENESNSAPVVPKKASPPVNPVAAMGSSSSMPPTPAVAPMLSPTKSVSRGVSGSSAPVTPRTKSFQLPPSHHFPHLQALLTLMSDDKPERKEDPAKAANVSADTTENARQEEDNVSTESIPVEELGHVTDVQNKTADATDQPQEDPPVNRVLHTLGDTEGDGHDEKTSDLDEPEIRTKEVLVETPQYEEEGSAAFAIASEDFTEENVRTTDTIDGNSTVRGEDGIASVGAHEIREALGLPLSKQGEQSSGESRATEDHSVEDRKTPIVTERMTAANETGHKRVEDIEQDDSSRHLSRKVDSVVCESSSPASDPNLSNSTGESNVIEKEFPIQMREVNDSQLCDVSSLVTEMYIANPFVPSPTSVQDVAVARNVAG